MTTFELIISFFSSGTFLALLAMFYKMGKYHEKIELGFKQIDDKVE